MQYISEIVLYLSAVSRPHSTRISKNSNTKDWNNTCKNTLKPWNLRGTKQFLPPVFALKIIVESKIWILTFAILSLPLFSYWSNNKKYLINCILIPLCRWRTVRVWNHTLKLLHCCARGATTITMYRTKRVYLRPQRWPHEIGPELVRCSRGSSALTASMLQARPQTRSEGRWLKSTCGQTTRTVN